MSGFSALGTPAPEHLALAGLARCDEADGNQGEARRRYEQVLESGRRAGDPGLTAAALEGLSRLALGERDGAEAERLTELAALVRRRHVRPAPPVQPLVTGHLG